MGIQPDMKLFKAPANIQESELPDYIKKQNLEKAKDKGLDIWNYDAAVLYAVIWDLQNDEKAKRVLKGQEIDTESDLLASFTWPRSGTITQWSNMVGDILDSTWVQAPGRVEKIVWHTFDSNTENPHRLLWDTWYDKMTQMSVKRSTEIQKMFHVGEKWKLKYEDIIGKWKQYLEWYNKEYGLAMYQWYVDYLYKLFTVNYKRNPTDAELFAFAFANSEHCDHWVFNWYHIIDWLKKDRSLFDFIKDTNRNNPGKTLVAYKDDAAAYEWKIGMHTFTSADGLVHFTYDPIYNTLKVESHNHPTKIYALEWMATWIGWLLRDLAAIGRWWTPNATSTTLIVSDLIENHKRMGYGKESALDIMAEWPIGAANYSNEFWVPNITWNFSVIDIVVDGQHWWYDKPTAIVWGKWNVYPENIESREVPVGARILYIWGSNYDIWFGWGSASSMTGEESTWKLDFASVQRGSPIMQSKAKDLINALTVKKWENPILKIGDVWASGWTNTTQELLHDVWRWGKIDFSKIPVADSSMSPAQICSNESQERYICFVLEEDVPEIMSIAKRFNTPVYDTWETTESTQYIVHDPETGEDIIDMDINDMLGHNVELTLEDNTRKVDGGILDLKVMSLWESVQKVISHWSVWNKDFLVTIWDRSVWWRVVQDQMVWGWQTPLSNVWVTLHGLEGQYWELITQANRAALAIVDSEAASRMSVTTAILKSLSAYVEDLDSISCSGNWMYSKNAAGQLASLYKWVESLRDALDVIKFDISVWKDSWSMEEGKVLSPVTLVTTIYADVEDVKKILTPDFKNVKDSEIFLIDFWEWKNRLGWSILAQSYEQFGNEIPDVDNLEYIRSFMEAMKELHKKWLLLAYHKKSHGWLLWAISEMSFASHIGVDIDIDWLIDQDSDENRLRALFNEEQWVIFQFESSKKSEILQILKKYNLEHLGKDIWKLNFDEQNISFSSNGQTIIDERRVDMQKAWSQTSLLVKSHRKNNNPKTTREEFDRLDDEFEPPMKNVLTFDIADHPALDIIADYETNNKPKPKMAILSTEWTNSQEEMKRYFKRAWFDVYDVHLNDLKDKRHNISDFSAVAIAGWFSHGDTLWAGVWFAQTILETPHLREQFSNYKGKLLGTCNGLQVITQLAEILEWWDQFPEMVRNESRNFEARKVMVKITENPDAIFFKWMNWSILSQINSHWEWRAKGGNINYNIHYVDHKWEKTESYPHNPNGSPNGATWFEIWNIAGMMGHPEREHEENSPWLQIAYNMRVAIENEK